jgi:hypothetical protein
MANIAQGSTDVATAQAQPQTQQGQEINLDELTTEQAFGFITSAVRSQPFNYMEHVQLEQARSSVANALELTDPAAQPQQ